jgi:hypothetical protein
MFTILQIESMDDCLLYSKFVVVFLILLLIVVHLFGDMLMSIPMTAILM